MRRLSKNTRIYATRGSSPRDISIFGRMKLLSRRRAHNARKIYALEN